MWPETKEDLAQRMIAVNERAAHYNRTLDYGLRVHMIVRDTEAEAREYAQKRWSLNLMMKKGALFVKERLIAPRLVLPIRHAIVTSLIWLALLSLIYGQALGVHALAAGCLIGSADQILSEIEAYQKMGMRSFIFSGYPHLDECDYIGKLILPELKTCSLPHEYGRVPASMPATPLGTGIRR